MTKATKLIRLSVIMALFSPYLTEFFIPLPSP